MSFVCIQLSLSPTYRQKECLLAWPDSAKLSFSKLKCIGLRATGPKRTLAAGWVFPAVIPTTHSIPVQRCRFNYRKDRQTDGWTDGRWIDTLRFPLWTRPDRCRTSKRLALFEISILELSHASKQYFCQQAHLIFLYMS